MGDEPATIDPEFEKLRKQFMQEKLFRFQPVLNAIEDANWNKPIHISIDDTKWTFRKFTHAEVTLITGQPYFHKLIAQEALDAKEEQAWQATQRAMTVALCAEPNRWSEFADLKPEWVGIVFASLMKESTVNVPQLDDFFGSEYGWNYGLIWFGMMHRTPTEVGAISEGDYQAVNSWFRKNAERMNKK